MKKLKEMNLLREMKWDALMTGLLYIVLGIVALVIPETMVKSMGYLIGIILIVGGAVSMISYLLRDAHQNYYHNDFLHGLIGIAAGVIVLNKVEFIISLIPFLLGALILVSGCSKLQDVIDMKRMEYGNWIAMLVAAVVNVGLGILLVCNPFKAAELFFRLLGAGLILSGLGDCVITLYFAAKIRKYLDKMRAVDGTYVEVTEKKGRGKKNWNTSGKKDGVTEEREKEGSTKEGKTGENREKEEKEKAEEEKAREEKAREERAREERAREEKAREERAREERAREERAREERAREERVREEKAREEKEQEDRTPEGAAAESIAAEDTAAQSAGISENNAEESGGAGQ
ncbi:MAG: DUF308 domain-containing protein [bacterium]|nr:DUF308 domain-containing protein [bacterium]